MSKPDNWLLCSDQRLQKATPNSDRRRCYYKCRHLIALIVMWLLTAKAAHVFVVFISRAARHLDHSLPGCLARCLQPMITSLLQLGGGRQLLPYGGDRRGEQRTRSARIGDFQHA